MTVINRTATCGELRSADAGSKVVLSGWVHRVRDHGGVRFVNIRDRYGVTQVVVDEDAPADLKETVGALHNEYCIAVRGTVRPRPDGMVNDEMLTGAIEVAAEEIRIYSASETPPFTIGEVTDAREELRFRYRYLDMRSFSMQRKLVLRHRVALLVRRYLSDRDFIEVETPTMIRSTPEGARDFVIPSRLHPGSFYALAQSPQLYKQLLMVGGVDRYFQLAHCYRDEDARGDRQPEHTQIDIEMSFITADDVHRLVEGMLGFVFRETLGVTLPETFPQYSYTDAIARFGTDKPDLRFDLFLQDVSDVVSGSDFQVFARTVAEGGVVKALVAPGLADYSRKQVSELEAIATKHGAKGLAWTKVTDGGGLDGGIARFLGSEASDLVETTSAKPGDLLLFVADRSPVACRSLGAVRSELGPRIYDLNPETFAFAWVVDFPLFEWNETEERWEAAHHMFTMPKAADLETMEAAPRDVKGDQYDLVCNGYEIASGSIRIHDPAIQQRVFDIVGFSREEAQRRFGFLLDAFRYGPPPHGGIAPGLDRLVMLMAGETTIREVIAFPKTTTAFSPLDGCPAPIDDRQLAELSIRPVEPAKPSGATEAGATEA